MVPKYRSTAPQLSSLADILHPEVSTRLVHKSLPDSNLDCNVLPPNLFFCLFGFGVLFVCLFVFDSPHAIKLPLFSQVLDSATWESSHFLIPHIEFRSNTHCMKCALDIIHTLSSNSAVLPQPVPPSARLFINVLSVI